MLRENRSGRFETGISEALDLSKKLQALTDENLYLERHLATLVLNNRTLQSMRSRKFRNRAAEDYSRRSSNAKFLLGR